MDSIKHPTDKDIHLKLQNIIKLCETAMAANNDQEALLYANQILELDSNNTFGWFYKMKATYAISTLGDLKCREIIAYGGRAIESSPTLEFSIQIFEFFLTVCLNHLKFCMSQLQNTESIKALYDAEIQLNLSKATDKTLNADKVCNMILNQKDEILSLRFHVPNAIITNNPNLAHLTGEIAKQWVYFQNAVNERFNVYGAYMNETTLIEYRGLLNKIKEGLPPEKINEISTDNMTNEQKSGCYIATAVYGSYNAPEVIVLRRFRDHYLRKYFLGRGFIKLYYFTSPSIARRLKNTIYFNKTVRSILNAIVSYLQKINR
ncbi:CFI-box-CTERM domain-containing protein [Parabacteroides segnis]|uniref:CFI-box-CTERM domain-containing protein n=1 Tax=Parabacteroides segnis TaxID=2763058 RepID=UPI0035126E33